MKKRYTALLLTSTSQLIELGLRMSSLSFWSRGVLASQVSVVILMINGSIVVYFSTLFLV